MSRVPGQGSGSRQPDSEELSGSREVRALRVDSQEGGLRGTKGVPRKGVGTSVNMRV